MNDAVSIELTVPSTVNVDQPAPKELIDSCHSEVTRGFSELFGGCRTIPGVVGHWVASDGNMVDEGCKIVQCFAPREEVDMNIDQILDLGAKIAEAMSQESVFLVIDGSPYFVDISYRIPGLCGTAPMPLQ